MACTFSASSRSSSCEPVAAAAGSTNTSDSVAPLQELAGDLAEAGAIDTNFLSDDPLKGLPVKSKLKGLKGMLDHELAP